MNLIVFEWILILHWPSKNRKSRGTKKWCVDSATRQRWRWIIAIQKSTGTKQYCDRYSFFSLAPQRLALFSIRWYSSLLIEIPGSKTLCGVCAVAKRLSHNYAKCMLLLDLFRRSTLNFSLISVIKLFLNTFSFNWNQFRENGSQTDAAFRISKWSTFCFSKDIAFFIVALCARMPFAAADWIGNFLFNVRNFIYFYFSILPKRTLNVHSFNWLLWIHFEN